jgi:hypothetical protein
MPDVGGIDARHCPGPDNRQQAKCDDQNPADSAHSPCEPGCHRSPCKPKGDKCWSRAEAKSRHEEGSPNETPRACGADYYRIHQTAWKQSVKQTETESCLRGSRRQKRFQTIHNSSKGSAGE